MRICIEETVSGYEIRLQASDRGVFDWLLSEFKNSIPHNQRRYEQGRWLVEKRAGRHLDGWLRAMANAGAEIISEAGPNFETSDAERVMQLYRELFLMPGAPVKLIEAARRILAVECHPDKPDGSEEKMKRVNVAADLILQIERIRNRSAA